MTSQDKESEVETPAEAPADADAEVARRPGMGRFLRWTAVVLGAPLGLCLLGLAVFVASGIPVDLSVLRGRIEAAASLALERNVTIEGPVGLVPAIWPTVQVEGIRVGNPAGWPDSDLLRLDLVRAQLSIPSLLLGDVRIEEVAVEGLAIHLETDAAGAPNWLLKARETAAPTEDRKTGAGSPALRFIELQELSLRDIAVVYRDAAGDRRYELKLNEVTGSAESDRPMQLFVQGAVQNLPYAVTLTAGDLGSLVDGEAPWQLDLSAAAIGLNLTVTGEIAEPLRGRGLALDFVLTGPKMQELAEILDTELPQVGAFDLRGRILEAEDNYRVTELQGRLAGTAFAGAFEVDVSAPRPRLQGAIEVPRIDVGPLAAALAAGREKEAAGEGQPKAESVGGDPELDIDDRILTLKALEAFDAELALTIGELANAGVAVSDASFRVTVADGQLTGPMSATLAEVPFQGEVRLAREGGDPAVGLSLSAESSDIGELLALLTGATGIEGAFEAAELEVSSRGGTIRSLVEKTELRFGIAGAALSYGHEAQARPVEFALDSFEILFPASAESRITAVGSLLQEPFSLEISGGTFIENYVQRNWPIELTASGGGAALQVSGTLGRLDDKEVADFTFSLTGEALGGLSRWVGVAPEAGAGYALRGAATRDGADLRLRIDEGRIGQTALEGSIGSRQEGDRAITSIELAFGTLDPAELAGLAPEAPEAAAPGEGPEAFTIDLPILPQGIELIDSDIAVTIARIKAEPKDVTEVSFAAEIRDGHAAKAPLRASLAGAAAEGSLSADLRGRVPAFGLDLRSERLNLGDLAAQLGVAQGLELTAGALELSLALRGATLRGILEGSEFSAGIRDGLWRLRDPNTEGSLEIRIPEGRIKAPVGEPIVLALDGRIDRTPVKIDIRTDSLASFAEPKDSLSATLSTEVLNTALVLTGTAPLPIRGQDLRFELDFSGQRLSDLDQLVKVSLPPWGPYRLSGSFGSREAGYFIQDLRLGIGSSSLSGALDLDTLRAPPRLNLEFTAPTVQIDDFATGDWSPGGQDGDGAETPETASGAEERVQQLLSPQVMRSLDAAIKVAVTEVLSGRDRLGSGGLTASLEGGRLTVDPITVEVPGGQVDLGFVLEPGETEIGLETRAKIDGLDYGLLARRIDPESTTGGLINLDVDVKTRGPELAEVMGGAEGHVDFAVWPKDLEAGIFDLWAVNLFTSVLPSLDPEVSKVNCLVGRFGLEDGIMRTTALLIDTSRIQASADGIVDFKKNSIDLRAAPRSKRPEMFSAQTPIRVRGRLEDFELGVSTGAIAGTVFRMITSPVVVPFEWVFTKDAPADGEQACREAWSGTGER